jgi:hypothetical protein
MAESVVGADIVESIGAAIAVGAAIVVESVVESTEAVGTEAVLTVEH